MGIRLAKSHSRPPLAYVSPLFMTAVDISCRGRYIAQNAGSAGGWNESSLTIRYKKISPLPQIIAGTRFQNGDLPVVLLRRRPLILVFGEANMLAENVRIMTRYGFEELRGMEDSLSNPVVIYVEWGSCVTSQASNVNSIGVIPKLRHTTKTDESSTNRNRQVPLSSTLSIAELPTTLIYVRYVYCLTGSSQRGQ
jgi:hypothetical protein